MDGRHEGEPVGDFWILGNRFTNYRESRLMHDQIKRDVLDAHALVMHCAYEGDFFVVMFGSGQMSAKATELAQNLLNGSHDYPPKIPLKISSFARRYVK